jgi:hypothetical protein
MRYKPGNFASPAISYQLREFAALEGSPNRILCGVRLRDGTKIDRVEFVHDERGRGCWMLNEIESLFPSPYLIPKEFRKRIQAADLSFDNAAGGALIYTLILRTGRRCVFVGYNDFLPDDVAAADVSELLLHEGCEEFRDGGSWKFALPGVLCEFVYHDESF